MRRGEMKKVFLLSLFVFIFVFSTVSAQDIDTGDILFEEEEEIKYHFPKIKPELSIYGGYRFVELNDSERAAEYEYLDDSVIFGVETRIFSYPHRLTLDFDWKNENDFFGDLGFGFRDLVLVRGISNRLFHNLDNIRLTFGLNSTTPPPFAPAYFAKDGADEKYDIEMWMNTAFVRLKTPQYPLHLFFTGDFIARDGERQQRSILGSGWFNSPVRTTQGRDVDEETRRYTIGINSHIGPIEAEYSYSEKRFDVGGDAVLFDSYTNAGAPGPGPPLRQAGVWPHNLTSELKGSTNTIKVHTSHTGKLVASATLSVTDRENEESRADADYLIASGAVTWMPMPRLTFFVRYRHKEIDIDNPDNVTIVDRTDPSNIYGDPDVRPSMSSITDTVSVTGRYRPLKGLTLRARYSYEDHRRSRAEAWFLEDSTQKNTVTVSAVTRPLKNLNFEAKYIYKSFDDPAYNVDPDHSNEGIFSLSWSPISRINALVSYSITGEDRDDLHYVGADGTPIEGPENRDVSRERLMGSLSVAVLKDLSLTTSYSYMHNKVEQDIVYASDVFPFDELTDSDVPYKDMVHSYAVHLSYMPKETITLNAGVTHTRSRAKFSPNSDDLLQPVSVASFSELKIRETLYSVSGDYDIWGGFKLGVDYRFRYFDDVIDSPIDDVDDGDAHIIMLAISKRW
jgi:hypothetical protein